MPKEINGYSLTIDAQRLEFESITPPLENGQAWDESDIFMVATTDDIVMVCGTEDEILNAAASLAMCVFNHRLARERQ